TTAVALAAVMKHSGAVGSGQWAVGSEEALPALSTAHCPPPAASDVECEFYTDVDGIYTTDPRLVPEARKMDVISYDEMLELASVGANVLHSRSVEFARKFHVPLQKRGSFTDTEGTWIVPEVDWMKDVVVCGAALVRDEGR